MRVHSHLSTRVAYTHPASDEAPFPTETIELAPGGNSVTPGQLERLRGNSLFQRHERYGYLAVVPELDENGLRLDGPTVAQYLKAGCDLEGYPPFGYAPKWTEAERLAVGAARKAAEDEAARKAAEDEAARKAAEDEAAEDALTEDDSPNLPDVTPTVWDRREGEKSKAYAARIAALDSFVGAVAPLPEAERDALLGAASDDEKAALLTPKPKG